MGLLSTKEAANSTPLLITLPILTISFHLYCKGRYEPAFVKHPLQVSLDVATGVQFLYFFSDCQSKSNTQKSNAFRDTLCFELAFFILFLVMVSKFRHSFTKFELILFPLLLVLETSGSNDEGHIGACKRAKLQFERVPSECIYPSGV